MTKRSKRVAAVTASVLALAMILGSSALAKPRIHPTVTINAHQVGHSHRLTASGTYNNKSPKCKGPGGRPVALVASNGQGTTTTTSGGGAYSATFGHFNYLDRGGFHSYRVHVFVPGAVSGGYHKSVICYDASASTTVKFYK